jgi:tetratricopeptide (TPR) repeat protein
LLTGGSRTALPRHQTLRAVVDWSWDLLSEPEQILWRRLSIFTGGATLAAVERLCADGALGEVTVLDALTSLVDRSLLAVRDDGSEPRYLMLETIRAYGQMRLDESGEEPAVLAAHMAYFSDFADRARDELLRADQLVWLARLTADHDNLYAAVRNATAAGDVRTAIRLVGSLGWYWWLRGHRSDGVELVKGALAIAETSPVGDAREELATAYTVGALLTADGTHEMSLALEWLDAASALVAGDDVPATALLRMLGPLRATLDTFRSEGFREDYEAEMPIDDPDPWVAATSLIIRAHVQVNFGRNHDRAIEEFARALDTYRELGERWGIAFSLLSLATLAGWRGEVEKAIGNLTEAIRSVTEMGVWEDRLAFRAQLIRLLWLAGDRQAAVDALAQAEHEGQRVGTPEARSMVAWTAADLARWDGDLVGAAHHVQRAEELTASHQVAPQLRALIASARAYIEAADGDLDEARHHHRSAIQIAMTSYDAPVIAQVLVGLADLALVDGDVELAAMILGASTGVRGTPDLSLVDGRRVSSAARVVLGNGPYEAAYQRGMTMTTKQIGARVGVDLPELTAAPDIG